MSFGEDSNARMQGSAPPSLSHAVSEGTKAVVEDLKDSVPPAPTPAPVPLARATLAQQAGGEASLAEEKKAVAS